MFCCWKSGMVFGVHGMVDGIVMLMWKLFAATTGIRSVTFNIECFAWRSLKMSVILAAFANGESLCRTCLNCTVATLYYHFLTL